LIFAIRPLKALKISTPKSKTLIKFLFNNGADVDQIAQKLTLHFHEDPRSFRKVQFWIEL
jgi:hypothetical protein